MRLPRTFVRGTARSLTLLRLFLVAAAGILAVGAIVLTEHLTGAVKDQAIQDEVDSATVYANSVLSPVLVKDDRLVLDPAVLSRLEHTLHTPVEIRSIKVWRPDGRIAFTTLDPSRIGKNFGIDDELEDALRTGKAVGFIENLSKEHEPENLAEARSGIGRALTVYAPIVGTNGRPIGAYEVYLATERLDATIAHNTRNLWLTVIAVFGALYAALALLVRGASRRLRQQTEALRARTSELQRSYALLEAHSLETIETLNATVEAKDPYTAGHSHRVRAVSLLIGRELGFPPEELELLGLGALFHDVGKIGVPDAILTKPAKLTAAEFEIVKQHAARGAEIVAHISRLKDAVPLIRHHHERWDGLGYPDGLSGEAIPLEATIVGLADAWDAMTTVRPYSDALPASMAVEQVRAGRGTQFHPDVVDAFLAVARTASLQVPGYVPAVRALRPLSATG
ncbi:MAG TPA: HD domain-containing phosphohydrolase [Gaiellaceae bacterium]|nr:HD domain-containing phosphohydrolase [Gaiellaceae bacterium]